MLRRNRDRHQEHQPSNNLGEGGEEAARILIELAGYLEQFDSMIDRHRNTLEQRSGQSGRVEDLPGDSSLVRLEAAEMATRTQRALEELRRLAEPVKARPRRRPHRDGMPAPAQRTTPLN
jgi:hypothetical protein